MISRTNVKHENMRLCGTDPWPAVLGWALMSQQERGAALSEDRFTREYFDDGKISYL